MVASQASAVPPGRLWITNQGPSLQNLSNLAGIVSGIHRTVACMKLSCCCEGNLVSCSLQAHRATNRGLLMVYNPLSHNWVLSESCAGSAGDTYWNCRNTPPCLSLLGHFLSEVAGVELQISGELQDELSSYSFKSTLTHSGASGNRCLVYLECCLYTSPVKWSSLPEASDGCALRSYFILSSQLDASVERQGSAKWRVDHQRGTRKNNLSFFIHCPTDLSAKTLFFFF